MGVIVNFFFFFGRYTKHSLSSVFFLAFWPLTHINDLTDHLGRQRQADSKVLCGKIHRHRHTEIDSRARAHTHTHKHTNTHTHTHFSLFV